MLGTETEATVDGSSGGGPRVLPPWLQAQTPTSGSHSVSQDAGGDFSDVKSTAADHKKLSEVTSLAWPVRVDCSVPCTPGLC